MSSRRSFLFLSSAAAAVTAAPRLFAQPASQLASQREGMPVFSNASLGAFAQGSLTRAHFQSLIGSQFRVFMNDRKVAELTLTSVTSPSFTQSATTPSTTAGTALRGSSLIAAAPASALGGASLPAAPSRITATAAVPASTRPAAKQPTADQCFAVTFSSGSVVIPQDSYVVDHASLGNITLFLVPGQDAQGGKTATSAFYYL